MGLLAGETLEHHRAGRAPDLIVEIVSDSSTRKDEERLPPLYARAGIHEL
jgi:Uma2 family endonuclease